MARKAGFPPVVDANTRVLILGSLPGWMVAELYGAMDIAISPVRLPHGPLWTCSPGIMDPESYGYGRAIANSAGTPVLMSNMYDPSFTPETRLDLRFGDPAEGANLLRHLTVSPGFRAEMRSFAERRDGWHGTDSVRNGHDGCGY